MDMIVLPTVIACPAAGIDNLDVRSYKTCFAAGAAENRDWTGLSVATVCARGGAIIDDAF